VAGDPERQMRLPAFGAMPLGLGWERLRGHGAVGLLAGQPQSPVSNALARQLTRGDAAV
jgi:hypothetical protein